MTAAAGPAIVTAGLTKTFGAVTAVEALDLSVEHGEIFGLIGPDGAGKTTTMRMLAGILPPDGGTATVAECDVVKDPEAVKQRIGYLSQVFSLYGDLTIEENVDFVADLFRTPRAEAKQVKERMLEMTGLAPFRSRQAGRLSGGMKQKLALTCALIHRPDVLLLDEPTTGVDPVSRREFWRILGDLPEQGVTVLLSSPYMDEASRCHRLAMLSRGKVLAVGTARELCDSVEGVVLEVLTPQARDAARALLLPGVLGVTPFGDSLHVRMRESHGAEETVRKVLTNANVPFTEVAETVVSLEDAFIEIVNREGGR